MQPLDSAVLIKDLAHGLKVGEPVAFRNLTVWPLLGDATVEPGYLTLDEALQRGVARVTEVSASGSVPELKFTNNAEKPVFLMDGEELVGAKQNRVLNLSILAPAGKTIMIPVSCVEAGRWHQTSVAFQSSPRAHFATGRAKRNASVTEARQDRGSSQSDQGEVWSDIAMMTDRLSVDAPTHAMADAFEQHAPAIEDFVRAFAPVEVQVGAAFAVGGRTSGMDLFDCPATLAKMLPKLVRSYALDALATDPASEAPSATGAARLLQAVCDATVSVHPAVGEGEDLRFEGPRLAGGALAAWGRIVHLAAFRVSPNDKEAGPVSTTLASPASRRRNRGLIVY